MVMDMRPATQDEWTAWRAARSVRMADTITRWYGSADGAAEEAEVLLARYGDAPGEHHELLIGDGVHVAVSAVEGPARGLIDEVRVDHSQGNRTAALAAAIRWLAAAGCRMAVMTVDEDDAPSTELTRGWTDTSQRMALTLTTPPELPAGFSIRPVTRDELVPWIQTGIERFAASLVAAGAYDRAEALARSERGCESGLPGAAVPADSSVSVAESAGERVGILWLAHHSPGTRTFVNDIEIDDAQRGRGFGRTTMRAAEHIALERGDTSIGLNVFGDNTVARGLYRSLGYRITDRTYALRL